jgi:hypothetical protein
MLWPMMNLGVWVAVGSGVIAGVLTARLADLNHTMQATGTEARPSLAPVPVEERARPGEAPVPATPEAPVSTGVIIDGMTTDELLSRLESADRGLRTLQARVQRVRTFAEAEGGGTHIWRGDLEFEQRPGTAGASGAQTRPERAFAVHFSREIVDGVVRERSQSYLFDGTWLLELDATTRQFVRRRVVAEGSGADPLRIGEGPLPMPIGQKAADMRERFHVSLVPSLDGVPEGERFGRLREMLADCWQLRLVPRDGTEMARDYRDLRLWYRRADLLPVFAQTANADATRDEILLIDHRVNEPIAPGRFSTLPPEGEGWSGRTEEFRGPRALPAASPGRGGDDALKTP